MNLIAAAILRLVALQELVQRVNQTTDGVIASWHALVGGEEQAEVIVALQGRAADERHEVLDVVGQDRTPFLCHPPDEFVVGKPDQIDAFGDGGDVMAAGAELPGDLGRVVLIQQEPHANASPRRRQRSSSRSAIARARSIQSSISAE